MMEFEYPEVKGKYVIVELPPQVGLSSDGLKPEVKGTVKYVGKEADYYCVEAKVLFPTSKATELKYFATDEGSYWKMHQDFILCEIKEGHAGTPS